MPKVIVKPTKRPVLVKKTNILIPKVLVKSRQKIQQGYITVPDGPGLGIELDEGVIKENIPEGESIWS